MSKQTKFLKQAGTGRFYLYTKFLAARPDMFPANDDEVPVAMGGTMGAKKEAPAPAKKAEDKADK
jgi:hypothetical protein